MHNASARLAARRAPGLDEEQQRRILHVLLRHRLLPQPHGFEGFVPGPEDLTPRDQAIREPEDLPRRSLHRDAATPTAPDLGGFGEDAVIIQGRYLLDLEVGLLKGFGELLEPLSGLRPPAVDVSKPDEGQGLPYDIWAEETQPGIPSRPG